MSEFTRKDIHGFMARAGWKAVGDDESEPTMWRYRDRILLSNLDVENEIGNCGSIAKLLPIPDNPDLLYKAVRASIIAPRIKCGCCDVWFETQPGMLPPFWNYYSSEKILICPACVLSNSLPKLGKGVPIFITPNVIWKEGRRGHKVPCKGCEHAINQKFPGTTRVVSKEEHGGQLAIGEPIPICYARVIGTVEGIKHLIGMEDICDIRHLTAFQCKRGYWVAVTKE